MIKALLCDLDGTLVESNWLHAEAWQVAFGAIGIHLEREAVRRQIGKGGDELIPVFVPWWRRKFVEMPLKDFRAHLFKSEYRDRVEPLPGARDLLLRLKETGVRVALASSADKDDLLFYKGLIGIEDLVDKQTSADDADRSKPEPDIFVAALHRLGLKAPDVLALGDTPWDAEAAGKANVWTIGVESGGWSRNDLLAAGCIEVYKSVADLLEHLNQSAILKPR